ncbi:MULTISPECIES: ABC transporter permease [unclassified Streptomyces]|uniref:ABC transporter permease n=1 Tax=unclassified Streptomyces TaxID=2593676 RepID=UPI002DD85B13|nr:MULTISPECIES: ABC transporter permease [unclassified Streptomyces]WSA93985.1 ABC transporter permease [Streptomyces sp. NBC_01795]WSB78410.1 ABC transporter permease [Streptomyces sp. NBC_01775]WSS13388.1 ABC transporter permease [Streptomyces sp. NBC_01186]WSS42177.1 ABC transporter permease [Streptomyces sp. NBC_01187]
MSAEPVIPDFGDPSACVAGDATFCTDWFTGHWSNLFWPALLQHLQLTLIAVVLGFVLAVAAAILCHFHGWLAAPLSAVTSFLYTVPPLALFQLLVPVTGFSVLTVETALVLYSLYLLFTTILTGLREVPQDAVRAARGMGLTRLQILFKVELRLAVPSLIAGLRVATVMTIGIVAIAAYVVDQGLGSLILKALQSPFNTQFIGAGALAVVLALVADGVLVLAGRLLTPWARTRRAA